MRSLLRRRRKVTHLVKLMEMIKLKSNSVKEKTKKNMKAKVKVKVKKRRRKMMTTHLCFSSMSI